MTLRYPLWTRRRPPSTFWERLVRDPVALFSLATLVLIATSALAAPVLSSGDPNAMVLGRKLLPPGAGHPLGTDLYGRDILTRLLYGGRTTLSEAILAVSTAMSIGVALGTLAAADVGHVGGVILRVMDVWLAFPSLLLALLLVAIMGPGVYQAGLAVGLAGVPFYVRATRSALLTAREMPYVESARAIGCSRWCIWTKHLLPTIYSPLIVLATSDVGMAIMNTAALGFLGLGSPPPTAEWGLMLLEGRQDLWLAPWASIAPGAAIALAVLAATLLGDAIGGVLRPWEN